jgi:hypothetical protein
VEQSIDPQPDAEARFARIEVDVGRLELEGSLEQQVDERPGADNIDQFPQLFLQRFLTNSRFLGRGTHGIPFTVSWCGASGIVIEE